MNVYRSVKTRNNDANASNQHIFKLDTNNFDISGLFVVDTCNGNDQ